MKPTKSFFFGVVLMVVAVMAELAWIRTGDLAMGIYTLCAALSSAGLIGRGIRHINDAAERAQYQFKAAA